MMETLELSVGKLRSEFGPREQVVAALGTTEAVSDAMAESPPDYSFRVMNLFTRLTLPEFQRFINQSNTKPPSRPSEV